MNVLDWMGPDFLVFYVVAVVAALVVPGVLVWLLRGPGYLPAQVDSDFDGFELAYLTGGRERLVDAVVVSLWQRELVRVSKHKRMVVPLEGKVARHLRPAEEYVFTWLPPSGLHVDVLHRTNIPQELFGLRLRAMELVMPPMRAWVLQLLRLLPMVAVLLIGVIKIGVGISRDRPVIFLIILCVGTAILLAWLARRMETRTRRGDKVVSMLRRKHSALAYVSHQRMADLTWTDVALAAGLFGMGVLVGGPLGDVSQTLQPPKSERSWNWGSCSSGGHGCGGGGCGGGGGGGGGCGGCGGH